MNKLVNQATSIASSIYQRRRAFLLVLAVALFVLAAGAPNATIGIGK